jgi:hypothetical protein
MEEKELESLIKTMDLKSLKDAAKKAGIKPGRCPTKASIARMLPDKVLRELAGK